MINNFAVLYGQEFEDVDEETGWKSETSYEIAAYREAESTGTNIKCIIFMRILDNPLPEGLEKDKSKREMSEQPKPKKIQRWKVKSVSINGDAYDSYDEVLDGLEEKLVQISKCELNEVL